MQWECETRGMIDLDARGRWLVEAIIARKSVRSFRADSLPPDVTESIMRAGLAAPSAGGCLSSRFFIVETPRARRTVLKATYYQEFLETAPLVVVVASVLAGLLARYHHDASWANRFALQDAAASAQNALLAAWALGVGSTWVGGIRQDVLQQGLEMPPDWMPQLVLAFGYPQHSFLRRTPAEVVEAGRVMREGGV